MRIKVIKSEISFEDLQKDVDKWTEAVDPDIISANTTVNVVNDYYVNTAPPMVCNVWNEYIITIIYKTKS